MSRVSDVSGDFPVQLATRLVIAAGGLLRCMLPVCPCVMSFSKFDELDTHELLRTSRLHSRSILVLHARFPRDILATSSRVCHEDATRKQFLWN